MEKQISLYPSFEKIILLAGHLIVLLALAASAFSVIHNIRFVYDPFDVINYAKHFVLIGLGFVLGYLLSGYGPVAPTNETKVRSGLQFALLSYVLFVLLDITRVFANNSLLGIGYPWGKIIFTGLPIFALMLALVIHLLTLKWRAHSHQIASPSFIVVIGLFIATQILWLIDRINILASDEVVWMTLLNAATHPIVVTVVALAVFRRVTSFTERLSYAVAVGLLYMITYSAIWEFRTNPDAEATNMFQLATTAALVAGLALFFAAASKRLTHDAGRRKKSRKKTR